MKQTGKTIAQMREENPNFDKDLEVTFQLADKAAQPPSAAELIARHNALDDHVKAQSKAFSEYLKPTKTEMELIESRLQEMLLALNQNQPDTKKRASLSTDAGTAYLSTIVTPKLSDKTAFLDWVLEDWDHRGAMLQIGAPQKDALTEYTDANGGALPPAVETSSFTRINIRRS